MNEYARRSAPLGRRLSAFLLCCVLLSALAPNATARAADHPLEPLSASEMQTAFEVTLARFNADRRLPKSPLLFPLVALAEPPKAYVLSWRVGRPIARSALLHVLHYPSNRTFVVEVDLKRKLVTKLETTPQGTQASVSPEEYSAADELVHAYAPWQAAMRARGVDPDLAYVDVWAAGDQPAPPEVASTLPFGNNTRLLRCIAFNRGASLDDFDPAMPQNPYDRPIEGVVVTIDMNARKVVHMSDTLVRPVIVESGNARRMRGLRPLNVRMPRGDDIRLSGRLVRWHNWQFYVVLHPREGLVLYDVRYLDHGELRSVAYRLSLSEIYVPYGIGDANWTWRSAFDVGEYNAGTLAQPLEVDRDVPENARFLDAIFNSDGGPSTDSPTGSYDAPATLALFERDSGLSWTRTDPTTYDRDTRYGRELVATWNCWIGNYIYGFDWIFRLDGTIQVKVQLTGTTLNRGTTEAPEASAPKVGKDAYGTLVAAPNHQHFFSFRLDLDVDGADKNHVMEMEAAPLPNSGFKNAFDAVTRDLMMEGYRDADPFAARHWHVMGARENAFGKHTSYALEPGGVIVPYSAPDFPALERAQFALHQLWFTRYRDGELYAAGTFPNQAKFEDGVGMFSKDGESLDHKDVVLWYTTGLTHLARPEDYPVMPTESIEFKLTPRGFFAKNPALDVADQAAP